MRLDTKSIDGLRGLAALHVACGHILAFSREPHVDLIGGTSMGLFFIISGFVMALGYGQKKYKDNGGMICGCCCSCCDSLQCCSTKADQEQWGQAADAANEMISFPTRTFLWKRYARLAPMYYLTSLCALPTFFIGPPNVILIALSVILTFFFLTSWVVVIPALNGVLWTVSTMIFFYLCFPCLIPRLQQLKSSDECRTLAWRMYWLQLLIFVLVFSSFSLVDGGLAYWVWRAFPPNRLPVFVMGCCAGLISIRDKGNPDNTGFQGPAENDTFSSAMPLCYRHQDTVTPGIVFFLVVLMGSLFSAFRLTVLSALVRVLGEACLPVLFFDWILSLTRRAPLSSDHEVSLSQETYSWIEKLFRSKPLQFLGHISMSFYVVHLLILTYLGWMIRNTSNSAQLEANEIPGWAIPVVLALSLLFGWCATEYIELPAQKFILRLAKISGRHYYSRQQDQQSSRQRSDQGNKEREIPLSNRELDSAPPDLRPLDSNDRALHLSSNDSKDEEKGLLGFPPS